MISRVTLSDGRVLEIEPHLVDEGLTAWLHDWKPIIGWADYFLDGRPISEEEARQLLA